MVKKIHMQDGNYNQKFLREMRESYQITKKISASHRKAGYRMMNVLESDNYS